MRKEDLGLNCLKKEQYGPWLRAGTGYGQAGGMKDKLTTYKNPDGALSEGHIMDGYGKGSRDQGVGERDGGSSKGDYEGRKEEGTKNDAMIVIKGTEQKKDELGGELDQQGPSKSMEPMVKEGGKRDQMGKEMREQERIKGDIMLIEERRKEPVGGDERDCTHMQVEDNATVKSISRCAPLSDSTNTLHLGEGVAGTEKKVGTKG